MFSLGLFVLLQIFGVMFANATLAPHATHAPHAPHATHAPLYTTVAIPDEVDAAIVNINTHYNDALCLELLLVDCATHVTKGDEQVCGSNGVTYDNHCHFTHAVCETLHFDLHMINFQSHGACPHNAVSNTTPATVSNTTGSEGDVMFNLFCSNVASITCNLGELKVICGSDSQFYPNMCEFTKERCKNRTLVISTDPNRC